MAISFIAAVNIAFYEEVVSCREELVGSIKGTSMDGSIEAAEIERLVPEKISCRNWTVRLWCKEQRFLGTRGGVHKRIGLFSQELLYRKAAASLKSNGRKIVTCLRKIPRFYWCVPTTLVTRNYVCRIILLTVQMIPSFFKGILSDCVNIEHLRYTSDSSALTRKGFQRGRVCERYT